MATYQSEAAATGPRVDPLDAGKVCCRSAKYTNVGAKPANDVFEMVPVPKGALILDIKWNITALGVGRTIDIGDGGTVDRFFDGIDVSAAAAGHLFGTGGQNQFHTYAADDTVDVVVLGDTLPDGAVINMTVFYTMTGIIADETAVFGA